ncbi:response regulator transcription factor [Curtobacterium sp. MCBD17_021]|uniref:response regulator transcription factor n=1 Tax=Curtobacterium sp. MCBD17_021 TaxID=2175665 RepID=UPI00268DF324|nr:response regulator transcription factor [Curtobacterium sp. MCBD17_021]
MRATARDEVPLDPRIARGLLPRGGDGHGAGGPARTGAGGPVRAEADRNAPDLPPRERDVLVRLARGLSNRQIASELGIAERTVKVHVSSVFRRIGVADRTSAALWARDHGW